MNLGMETEVLEFKKSTSELREAVGSIVAILNKHRRGDLYFGVRADGTPIGQVVTEQTLRDISHQISQVIEPRIYPEIRKVVLDGKDCIHVHFEGTQVPYFAYGTAKIRTADEDVTLSRTALIRYIQTNAMDEFRWEMQVSQKTIEQADEALLRQFVEQAQQSGRLPIEYTDRQTVLNQLELTEGERLLNAGKALFTDEVTQDIHMAIFAGKERLTFLDIQQEHGPVLKLIELAEQYLKKNLRWRVKLNGETMRQEVPEIPLEAIREAIVNSFCHRVYATNQSNEVTIYSDRVEIYNPGRFPEGYTPEDYIHSNERPVRRNPIIAQTLYLAKQIENFGTGLRRIAKYCTEAGIRYEFQNLRDGFVVIFYRDENLGQDTPNSDTMSELTPKMSELKGKMSELTPEMSELEGKMSELTSKMSELAPWMSELDRQRTEALLRHILQNETVTSSQAASLLNIQQKTASRLLRQGEALGILRSDGKTRGKVYRLAEK